MTIRRFGPNYRPFGQALRGTTKQQRREWLLWLLDDEDSPLAIVRHMEPVANVAAAIRRLQEGGDVSQSELVKLGDKAHKLDSYPTITTSVDSSFAVLTVNCAAQCAKTALQRQIGLVADAAVATIGGANSAAGYKRLADALVQIRQNSAGGP